MDSKTFEEAIEQGQWPLEIDELSVYQAFGQVQDGRKKRAVRYRVEEILLLILLGKLVGMKTPAAIAEWASPSGPIEEDAVMETSRFPVCFDLQQRP